ncbi:MAG: dihydropteroate synthase [bacterium]
MKLASHEEVIHEVKRIGVDEYAVPILASKAFALSIKVESLDCAQSNIIKQTALSVGADAAVARPVVTGCSEKTDLILFANQRQIEEITRRLHIQPFGLRDIADGLNRLLDQFSYTHRISLPECELDLSDRTYVMGVLNVTPDSFSDGGHHFEFNDAVDWGTRMADDGADIIDIGGESTRPGSDPVTLEEELSRVIPVIEALSTKCDVPLSIDTHKSAVASEAIKAGCKIVNDISGLTFDELMAQTVAKKGVGLIIGHIRGTPKNMQQNPHYDDVMSEIMRELRASIQLAESKGVYPTRIIVDPGIGFGKRLNDNLTIIRRLGELKSLGKPIMVGPSRKSFIGAILNLPVDERLEGTAAAITIAVANGANLVRAHDVKEMKRVCLLADAIISGGPQ